MDHKLLISLNLFENKMDGQIPFDLEKLGNLKEMNISYNMFNGLVSKNLSKLDKSFEDFISFNGTPFNSIVLYFKFFNS